MGTGKLPPGVVKIPFVPDDRGYFFYRDEPIRSNPPRIHKNPGCCACQRWARNLGTTKGGEWYWCPDLETAKKTADQLVGPHPKWDYCPNNPHPKWDYCPNKGCFSKGGCCP